MKLTWTYLIIAGIFEIGWPLGFKLSQTAAKFRVSFIAMAVLSMALSGFFLWNIPLGTAYAVWTGIGASGTFLIGIVFFRDPMSLMRCLSLLLIVAGIIGLKISF